MSRSVSLNGTSFSIPQTGDSGWSLTGGVDDYLVALATGVLTKAGGAFTLTSEANFGATYGLKTAYYKTQTANPAAAGGVRLAKTDTVSWRNNANSGDLALTINGSDQLTFNGVIIENIALGAGNTALTMNAGGTAYAWTTITNAMVDAAAAIAYSKLALTGSIVNADLSASAAIAYSKLALTGSIVNADVSGSAAIAYSKLALSGALGTGDLASGFVLPTTKGGTGQNSTLVFPSSGTVLTDNNTVAVSNKTITFNSSGNSGGSSVFSDTVDATKKVTFDLSGISTSTIRSLVLPNASDTLIGRATTDTLTNKTISGASNTLTVRAANDITGQLPIGNGGTGQATANAALNALLPSQTSNAGKVLSTNGTDTSWAAGLTTTLNQYNTHVGDSSNVVQAVDTSLLGDVKAIYLPLTYAVTSASPGVFTTAAHGQTTGAKAYVTVTQNGFTANTTYYMNVLNSTQFTLCTTLANAQAGVGITSSGTTAGTVVVGGLQLNATLAGAKTFTSPLTVTDVADTSKQFKFSAANNSGSAVTTLATNSSGSQTITLPNATDTLVGKATTDILTNKDISSSTNTYRLATNAVTGAVNWYEEGTWTISLSFNGGGGTSTVVTRVANFTRIGRQVFFQGYVQWNCGDRNGGAQAMSITGLPYTANATANSYTSVALYFSGGSVPAGKQYGANITPGGTSIGLYTMGTTTAATVPTDLGFGANATVTYAVSGSYYV